jgi:hypothetical protein
MANKDPKKMMAPSKKFKKNRSYFSRISLDLLKWPKLWKIEGK